MTDDDGSLKRSPVADSLASRASEPTQLARHANAADKAARGKALAFD